MLASNLPSTRRSDIAVVDIAVVITVLSSFVFLQIVEVLASLKSCSTVLLYQLLMISMYSWLTIESYSFEVLCKNLTTANSFSCCELETVIDHGNILVYTDNNYHIS